MSAAVVWLTGLSGAGKSTIAARVADLLREQELKVELLDGDAIRDVFPNTGFTRADREAHIRRVGFLASRLEHHGVIVLAALISPYAESRAFVRRLCRNFVEVYVSTPIDVCERRDVKGLYSKARAGGLHDFTGIDAPYEAPTEPELVINTAEMTKEEAAARVIARIASVCGLLLTLTDVPI